MKILAWAMETIAQGAKEEKEVISSEDDDYLTVRSTSGLATTYRWSEENPRIGWTVRVPEDLIPAGLDAKDRRLSLRLDYDDHGLSVDIGSKDEGIYSIADGKIEHQALAVDEHGNPTTD